MDTFNLRQKLSDRDFEGLLIAERLYMLQEAPFEAVNGTSLRSHLVERKSVSITQHKVDKCLRNIRSGEAASRKWLYREGNQIRISPNEIKDHRSATALLKALEITSADKETGLKIVFHVSSWVKQMKTDFNFTKELCDKFLMEFRLCGYTTSLSQKEEEIHREVISSDRHVLEAIAADKDLIHQFT